MMCPVCLHFWEAWKRFARSGNYISCVMFVNNLIFSDMTLQTLALPFHITTPVYLNYASYVNNSFSGSSLGIYKYLCYIPLKDTGERIGIFLDV